MDYGKRIERVKEELVAEGKDALIVSGGADVQYFSGFEVYADGGTRGWYPLVVVPRDVEPLLLVGGLDREQAEETSQIECRVPEGSFSDHLKEFLGEGAEVLVSNHVSAGFYSNLSDHLSLEFTDAVQKMRVVKSDEEVGKIREAQQMTEEVFGELVECLEEGRAESEIAGEVEHRMRERGAIAAFPSVVASGSRAARPHHFPETVEAGEGALLFDIGARLKGYVSDFSRTLHLREPSDAFVEAYEAVRGAQEAGAEVLRAGVEATEVDDAVRQALESSGHEHEFPHASGHGIGLSVHEPPKLSFRSDEELEAGMVVTLEPGIYRKGEFGIRIEDTYLITETGAERLTSRSRQLDDHIIGV